MFQVPYYLLRYQNRWKIAIMLSFRVRRTSILYLRYYLIHSGTTTRSQALRSYRQGLEQNDETRLWHKTCASGKLYNTSCFQENTGNYCPEWDRPGETKGEAWGAFPGGLPRGNDFPVFSWTYEVLFLLNAFCVFIVSMGRNIQNHKILISLL